MPWMKVTITVLGAVALSLSHCFAQGQPAAPPPTLPAQQCVVISLDQIPPEKRREYEMLAEIGKALGRPMVCTECTQSGAKIITCNMGCRPGIQC